MKKKTLQELNMADDFLFAKVLSDPDICKLVIEKILNIRIRKVLILNEQLTIDLLLKSKAIRLDVYVEDSNNTIYNIEMQQRNRDIEKRSRYYQGAMDLDLIQKGGKYRDLKESFIIFICTFDLFGQDRHLYSFSNRCDQVPELSLNDGTHKIFINTRGTADDVDSEMKIFLKYIENSSKDVLKGTDSEFLKSIHAKVEEVKNSKDMEVEYMTLLSKYQDIEEEAMNMFLEIAELLESGLTVEEVARETDASIEMVRRIKEKLKK